MARNLANAVANARPVRAASAVGNAKALTPTNNKGLGAGATRSQAPHPSPVQVQQAQTIQAARAQGGTTMPWDARAQQESGEAFTAESNALNELGADWTGREAYYGFGANGADNPYSQAALLATHHEWNERGRSNASGLQAFAGSNVNAERGEVGRYTTSYGQLLQAYEAEKASKEAREAAAQREYEQALNAAQLGAIERAQQSEPEPVASSPSDSSSSPSSSSSDTGYKPGSSGNKKNTKKSGISNNRKA